MFVKALYFGRVCYSIGQYLTRRKYDVNVMSLSLNTDFQSYRKFDLPRENNSLLSLSVSNKGKYFVNRMCLYCHLV